MIRVATSLLIALSLAACGGSDGSPSPGSNADIVVLDTSPAEVNAGETVTFVITVANEGPAAASNVTLTHHLDGAPAIGSITCAATGGAACPAALGESMTLESLPAGGGLIFHIEVPGDPNRAGAVTSSMTAQAAADTNHANDTGESTTIALDLRNGDYTVFASNGRQYVLTLNFNELSYEMSGQQVNKAGSFGLDTDGVSYVFDIVGTARFRTSADMVVGGFDFNLVGSTHSYDHGVRPFVASRRFTLDYASLDGTSFNLLGLNLRRSEDHPPESRVLPSTFGPGVLKTCDVPIPVPPVRVDQCPADFLFTYALAVVGSEIRGIDAVHKDTIHFRLAQSGSSVILLRSEDAADNTGRHFRVGLRETTGLAGGSFVTSSTRTAWGSTTLSDTHYAFTGTTTAGTAIDEQADLAPLNAAAPAGLRRGLRSTDGAPIHLAQNAPLALMLGERGGVAEGTMDISVP